jgi:hypothetical protein
VGCGGAGGGCEAGTALSPLLHHLDQPYPDVLAGRVLGSVVSGVGFEGGDGVRARRYMDNDKSRSYPVVQDR